MNSERLGIVLTVCILGLFLFCPSAASDCKQARMGPDEHCKIVCMVGRRPVTAQEIRYKVKVEEAYGNCDVSEEAVLISLVNDALEREVAKMHNVIVTEQEINSFRKYVDENTKAPEILAKVKSVFGEDQSSYEQLYLAPKIINRKLRYWYSRNTEIHKSQRELIEKTYSMVRAGVSFAEAAEACNLDYSSNKYAKDETAKQALLEEYEPNSNESLPEQMWTIIQGLSEGEIYKNIIEDNYSYKIIKLVKKRPAQYQIESVTTEKSPFTGWFQEQIAKVTIKIFGIELRMKLATKYPNVSWVKKFCKQ